MLRSVPITVGVMECAHCHEPLSGRRRVYCDARCKKRAWRRRRAGVKEDALPGSGRRGRVPLAGMTSAQANAELAEIRGTLDETTAIVRARELLERIDTPEARRRLENAGRIVDEHEKGERMMEPFDPEIARQLFELLDVQQRMKQIRAGGFQDPRLFGGALKAFGDRAEIHAANFGLAKEAVLEMIDDEGLRAQIKPMEWRHVEAYRRETDY